MERDYVSKETRLGWVSRLGGWRKIRAPESLLPFGSTLFLRLTFTRSRRDSGPAPEARAKTRQPLWSYCPECRQIDAAATATAACDTQDGN